MDQILAFIIVLTIIAIAIYHIATLTKRYQSYLDGHWVGDPEFLKTAQLKDFQLFIARSGSRYYDAYIIITDLNGEFIHNQAFNIEQSTWRYFIRHGVNNLGSFKFNLNDPKSDIPTNVNLAVSVIDGSLTIYDNATESKIYAFLKKDHIASDTALAAYRHKK